MVEIDLCPVAALVTMVEINFRFRMSFLLKEAGPIKIAEKEILAMCNYLTGTSRTA